MRCILLHGAVHKNSPWNTLFHVPFMDCSYRLTYFGSQKIKCHTPSNTLAPFSSQPGCSYARNTPPETTAYAAHLRTKVHGVISEKNKSFCSPWCTPFAARKASSALAYVRHSRYICSSPDEAVCPYGSRTQVFPARSTYTESAPP